jgi:hypothetical protein
MIPSASPLSLELIGAMSEMRMLALELAVTFCMSTCCCSSSGPGEFRVRLSVGSSRRARAVSSAPPISPALGIECPCVDERLLIGWIAEIESSKPRAVCDLNHNELKLKMLDRKWTFDNLKVTTAMLMQGRDENFVLNQGIVYRGVDPMIETPLLDEDLTPQQAWEKLPDKKYPINRLRQSLRVLRVTETDDGTWLANMFRELSGLERTSDIRTYPWTLEHLKIIVNRRSALEDERTRGHKPKSTGSVTKDRVPGAGNVQNTRQRRETGKDKGEESVVVMQAGEQKLPV